MNQYLLWAKFLYERNFLSVNHAVTHSVSHSVTNDFLFDLYLSKLRLSSFLFVIRNISMLICEICSLLMRFQFVIHLVSHIYLFDWLPVWLYICAPTNYLLKKLAILLPKFYMRESRMLRWGCQLTINWIQNNDFWVFLRLIRQIFVYGKSERDQHWNVFKINLAQLST